VQIELCGCDGSGLCISDPDGLVDYCDCGDCDPACGFDPEIPCDSTGPVGPGGEPPGDSVIPFEKQCF